MRWKLTIEYDGTPFCGWQRQKTGIPSVQESLEAAFFRFCGQDVRLHVAGRTDAGVHAQGQVAHADLDYGERPLSGDKLAMALNAHLRPAPISVVCAKTVPHNFEARYDALNKLYTYRIMNRRSFPALERNRVWHINRPLDIGAMQAGARHLPGHHDFTTFRDSQCQAKSPVRTLDRLDIVCGQTYPCGGREILIHAEARSFLHHQVRNMVGTLALVGEGKWQPENVAEALAARDRTKGGPTAPPGGLYLVRIDYAMPFDSGVFRTPQKTNTRGGVTIR